MNFKEKLISGVFIKRYKRFFVDIKTQNKIVTAHCPNTGSMHGLLKKGNKVWVSKSDNPNRKLKYTLEIIQDKYSKVGINTHSTNKIFLDGLKNKLIKEFKGDIQIKSEVKYGSNTRFDFLVYNKYFKAFVEVKNVTLMRKSKVAEFPDAVTTRGTKHIKELIKAKNEGYDVYIAFVIQREDCKKFQIAYDIDKEYFNTLSEAVKKKLKILCYDCKFSSKGIKLNNQIKFTN